MRKIATESPLQRSFLCTAAAIQSAEADLHDESQPFSDEPTRPAKYTIRGKTQLYKQFRINPCEMFSGRLTYSIAHSMLTYSTVAYTENYAHPVDHLQNRKMS